MNENGTMMSSLGGPEEVVLKIDIESALRLKNPANENEHPSAFVQLNLPFSGCQPQRI